MGRVLDVKRGERHWNWKGGMPLCLDCKKPLSRTKPQKERASSYTGRCKVCAWKLRGSEIWNCGTCGKRLAKGSRFCRKHIGQAKKLKNKNNFCLDCGVMKNNNKPGRCRKCDLKRRTASGNKRIAMNLRESVRCRFKDWVKGRYSSKMVNTFGYSFEELRVHLESKFQDRMKWKDYGTRGWHIDHIRPLSSFDCSDPEEIKKAFALENLQPLWWFQNLKKSNKVDYVVPVHEHEWVVQCTICQEEFATLEDAKKSKCHI